MQMIEEQIPEGLRDMTPVERAEACVATALAMLVEAYIDLDRRSRDEQ